MEISINAEVYLKHSQTSMMELLANEFNGFQPLTIFAKISAIDIWLGSKYAPRVCPKVISKNHNFEPFLEISLRNIISNS